nr:polymorphic toxin-type HINT domain-containing protein [Actinomadura rayongensis]
MEYAAALVLVGALVAAVTIIAIPDRAQTATRAALCQIFTGKNCDGDKPPPSAGPPSPGGSPGTDPNTNAVPGSPEQTAYNNAKQRADLANKNNDDLGAKVKEVGDELLKFLSELVGIDDALKCIHGDIKACLWTLVGVVPWGKAFKILKKIPAAVKLGKRLKELWNAVAAARKEKAAADAALKEAERALAKKKAAQEAAKKAAEACLRKPNSFTAGTGVLMADGRRKPIEDVRVGDRVLAADVRTGATEPRAVTALIRHRGPERLVSLTVDENGLPGGRTATLTVTARHPFWVSHPYWSPEKGTWTDAGGLAAGDLLTTVRGPSPRVLSVRTSRRAVAAYNFTVEGLHTYHVMAGSTPVLVHNCTVDVPGPGFLTITAANPSPSEIKAAAFMAGLGKRVELRDPVGTRAGGLTSDLLVDGVPWDVYTPTTGNVNRIISAVASKGSQVQGGGVIIDLSRTSVTPEQLANIEARIAGTGARIGSIKVIP